LAPPITVVALKPLRDLAQNGWWFGDHGTPDASGKPTSKSPEGRKLVAERCRVRILLDIEVNLIDARVDEAAAMVDRTPRLQPKSETSGFAENLPGAPDREDGS
jgi:hypothetical protein